MRKCSVKYEAGWGTEFPGGNGQEEESHFNSGCFLYITPELSIVFCFSVFLKEN